MIDRVRMDDRKPFFVFELANNHMGDVAHGLRIIHEAHKVARDFPEFRFGFKLQYRHLDTFIHPDPTLQATSRYVKRFSETRLSDDALLALRREIGSLGATAVCTPFDEASVDAVQAHGFDIIKIGSCSITDWPLLERVAQVSKPIIASTAGATLEDLDRVVSFFQHRDKDLSLMHCVAEYPCPEERLQLDQIDLLRERYPGVPIGFSTHEPPGAIDPVKVAVAKGAVIFEKHVGLRTERYGLNDYSASPDQARRWLEAARSAFALCGVPGARYRPSSKELTSLRELRRGVFAKAAIAAGHKVDASNTFLAMPTSAGQLTANDMSKYVLWTALEDVAPGKPVLAEAVARKDIRARVYDIVQRVKAILRESRTVLPGQIDLEISHHYGIDRFDEYGIAMLTYVNREYSKKVIVVLPGQTHPEQFHRKKEETFLIVWGDLTVHLDGQQRACKPGDIVLIEREVRHSFSSRGGAVIEELSSTHDASDSYYTDGSIGLNKDRKTFLTYWLDPSAG